MGLKRHENEARRPPFTTGAESHHLHPGGYEPLMTIVNTRGWGRGGQDVFCEVQIVSEKSFKKVLMWMCADATLEVRSCDPDGDERLLTRPSITRPGGSAAAKSPRSSLGGTSAGQIPWCPKQHQAWCVGLRVKLNTSGGGGEGGAANGEELGETTEEGEGQFQKVY